MSPAEAQEVKNLLLHNNDQYRDLAQRHHQLDDRLHELLDRHYLSTQEQLEEVTLKKRKLALKDEMERIAREYLLREQEDEKRPHAPDRLLRRFVRKCEGRLVLIELEQQARERRHQRLASEDQNLRDRGRDSPASPLGWAT